MKKAMATSAIFFVLMAIIFAWILYFGLQKLYFTADTISETDRIEIKDNLKDALEYCNDPLNAGNFQTMTIKNSKFNSLCIVEDKAFVARDANKRVIRGTDGVPLMNNQLQTFYMGTLRPIYDGGENVVLLKTTFGQNNQLLDYQVIDAFQVDVEVSGGYTECLFDEENKGYFDVKIPCE